MKIIVQLIRNLDIIKEPAARALIVWIIGEYCTVGQIIPKVIPTVLQYLARCFTLEELDTKHQILNTAAKVFLELGIFYIHYKQYYFLFSDTYHCF